jgi:hypothetical protein
MARKAAGESKRGLVVTLVFFILATIGAGLAAYYGFAEQDKLKKAVIAEQAKAKVSDAERNWYRFYVGVLLHYIGNAGDPGEHIRRELPNKAAFDQGSFPPNSTDQVKADAIFLRALTARLNRLTPWDPVANAPKNLQEVIKSRDAAIADLKTAVAKADQNLNVEKLEREKTQKDRKEDKKAFNKAVEAEKEAFKADREDFSKKLAAADERAKKAEDKKNLEFIAPVVKQNEELLVDNKKLRAEIKVLNSKVIQLNRFVRHDEETKPSELKPVGKIVYIHRNPNKATIDLGRRDGLKPQTTFEVFGLQQNGRLNPKSKGSIEVVTVGETTAEVVVTATYSPDDPGNQRTGLRKRIDVLNKDNTDPMKEGDVLVSRIFNPNAKTHVVIAGMIDFTGSGAISLQSLIQMLERQNVVVDAYVNPADGELVGRLTRRTDFVLLGTKPTGREPGLARDADARKKLDANIDKLVSEANANAIPKIQPRRFLEETGFNLPRSISRD